MEQLLIHLKIRSWLLVTSIRKKNCSPNLGITVIVNYNTHYSGHCSLTLTFSWWRNTLRIGTCCQCMGIYYPYKFVFACSRCKQPSWEWSLSRIESLLRPVCGIIPYFNGSWLGGYHACWTQHICSKFALILLPVQGDMLGYDYLTTEYLSE